MKRGEAHTSLFECPDAETVEWLLSECRANIAELADDLKGFYEPEKGWPPHIEKAHEMLAELDDALGGNRV